jgi:hypothetical protein
VIDVMTAVLTAIGETTMTTPEIEGITLQAAPAAAHEPKAMTKATNAPKKPRVAPEKAKSGKKAKPAQKRAKTPKAGKKAKEPEAKAPEATGPREGSKTAQVVALLQRKNGATLEEIMDKMGWQRHTVRGFMAGAMKKAGYNVESFKSEKGERTYRINA